MALLKAFLYRLYTFVLLTTAGREANADICVALLQNWRLLIWVSLQTTHCKQDQRLGFAPRNEETLSALSLSSCFSDMDPDKDKLGR